jgi:hypothetical protein
MTESPMDDNEHVEVWRFRRFDTRAGQFVISIGKATVSTIEGFGAETIPGSMESIPPDWLDVNGIYTPPTVAMSAAARRRLERLRAQYVSILEEEDHERLEGWSDRVESVSSIVEHLDERLAQGPDNP